MEGGIWPVKKEGAAEDDEQEVPKRRPKEPGSIGSFAVESEPSAPETAWANTARPEEDEKPAEAPETVPEPPIERSPEPNPAHLPEMELIEIPETGTVEAPEVEASEVESAEPLIEDALPEVETVEAAEGPDEGAPMEAPSEPEQPPELESELVPDVEPASETVSEASPELPAEPDAGELNIEHSFSSEPEPTPPAEQVRQPEVSSAPEPGRAEPQSEYSSPEQPEQPTVEHTDTEVAEPADERPFEFSESAAEEEPAPIEVSPEQVPEEPPGLPEPEQQATEPNEEEPDYAESSPAQPYQPATQETVTPEHTESSRAAEEKVQIETAQAGSYTDRRAENLSHDELIEFAQKIDVDGNNLRDIYETHLIGEHGLQRLVAEYQRGGDLREALRRELLEHEIDFERDPIMRDLAAPTPSVTATPNDLSQEPDGQLIGRPIANEPPQAAINPQHDQGRAAYEAAALQHSQTNPRLKVLMDVLLVTFIVILAVSVLVVYLKRA